MPPVARPARSNCRTSDSALLPAAQLGQGLHDLLLALDDFGQEADAVDVAVGIPGRLHQDAGLLLGLDGEAVQDRKSTRLNSSHSQISYAVFCLKKKKKRRR